MANNVVSLDKKKKANTSEKVEGFVKKNRVTILVIVAVLVVVAVTVAVVFGVIDSNTKKNLAAIDQIELSYTKDSSDLDETEIASRKNAALEALSAYTGKSGVSGVRANMLAGSIYFENEEYAPAAECYVKAAESGKKSYTAGINYFNAAVAFEETGDTASALTYYAKASESPFDMIPNALFNLGRLNETLGNTEAAVAAYQKIVDDYSSDNWADLAQSRIMSIVK